MHQPYDAEARNSRTEVCAIYFAPACVAGALSESSAGAALDANLACLKERRFTTLGAELGQRVISENLAGKLEN